MPAGRGDRRAYPGRGGSRRRVSFRRWGAAVRSAQRFGATAYVAGLVLFVLGLAVAIVVGLPLFGCAALAGGAWFGSVVDGLVRRRISIVEVPVCEAAIS